MINQSSLPVLLAWNTAFTVLAIILGVALIAIIVLSILGKRMQKKQAENEVAMQQSAQTMSMLVIDKKKMKLKESGLPQIVIDQTPKYMRRAKVPIVKAKIGPKIMSLMCDEKIFPQIPVKKEIKAVVSGIYIMDVRGSRNNLEAAPVKKGFMAKIRDKATSVVNSEKEKSKDEKPKSKKKK